MARQPLPETIERRRKAARGVPRGEWERVAFISEDLELAATSTTWPDPKWANDPEGFANIILGVRLWHRQIAILETIIRERHTAIMGGRKLGKDFLVAVAALLWYASYDEARVFMLAVTEDQVENVLYREIKKLHFGSGRCLECKLKDPRGPVPCPHSTPLDGTVNDKAETGIKASKPGDLREITGMTARKAEGAAGISGTRVLYIQDEASGQSDAINKSILGNMASEQCKRVILSNGTRNEGFFFDAFHEPPDKRVHHTFQVSSLESPNIVEGREVFPGLADRVWLEEMRRIWGEGSAEWIVHVLGRFAENEEAKIINMHAIESAVKRWRETIVNPTDRLQLGIDVAGEGDKGDESIFIGRRGYKQLSLVAFRGLTVDEHVAHTAGIVRGLRRSREGLPLVVVDREGPIGYRVWIALDAYADAHPEEFAVAGVRASSAPLRERENYGLRRDELWGNMANWIRAGGALLEDPKLKAELHAPEWTRDARGRRRATDKRVLKKKLGRSPDRAEAACLSVWEPADFELGGADTSAEHERAIDGVEAEGTVVGIDPYSIDGMGPGDNDGKDPVYG